MKGRLHVNTHPLVAVKIGRLQNPYTGMQEFKQIVREITVALTYDALAGCITKRGSVQSAVDPSLNLITKELDFKYAVVPILRAGLGMSEAVMEVLPFAKTGHIGMFRDENTLFPVEYYTKLPKDIADRHVLLVDPMVATGNSIVGGLRVLKKAGARCISVLSLFTTERGMDTISAEDDSIPVYTAFKSEAGLNKKGYIIDGCGDAGDRIFGTQ